MSLTVLIMFIFRFLLFLTPFTKTPDAHNFLPITLRERGWQYSEIDRYTKQYKVKAAFTSHCRLYNQAQFNRACNIFNFCRVCCRLRSFQDIKDFTVCHKNHFITSYAGITFNYTHFYNILLYAVVYLSSYLAVVIVDIAAANKYLITINVYFVSNYIQWYEAGSFDLILRRLIHDTNYVLRCQKHIVIDVIIN
jgi:hypothetical protein